VKFLIAGLGSIGRRHLRNLVALGEQDIVLYRTGKSTLPDQELAQYSTEDTLEGALAHHPDAVIVSNPTALHLDIAIPAAKAGCHLLLEKPISHSLERVKELKRAVEENRIQVLIGYQFRFHPVLRVIKKYITEGKFGKVIQARAHWGEYLPDWHPWEDYVDTYAARKDLGGGVVLTLSHPIDYLNWFFGEAERVWGWFAKKGDWDLAVEDTAEITILHNSDVISSVHLDYLQRPVKHDLSISGTKGSVYWSNMDGRAEFIEAESGSKTPIYLPEGFERNDLFLAEIEHFKEVIRGRAHPICTLEDGIHDLQIALTVLEHPGLEDFRPLIPLS